jgi:hypothetical protein
MMNCARWMMPMVLAAACGLSANPLVLGTNWVVNGDAESDTGSTDGSIVPVSGWTACCGSTLFTVVQYLPNNGFPGPGDPGPASRGANFFAGGPNVANASGSETIDVSGFAASIDLGLLTFDASAYLGGYQGQDDIAEFVVDFRDSSNALISSGGVVGPDAMQRGSLTGLSLEENTGVIPVGTRSIQFILDMFRQDGTYDDGYADNLSFVVNGSSSSAPEPGSAGLMAVGGVVIAGLGWRRRVRG